MENTTIKLISKISLRNGMTQRSRTDVAAQILQAASDSVTRTRAMYSAFVSFAQLKDYLAILTENGLLEYDNNSQTYRTTEKGLVFLRAYNDPSEREIKLPKLRSLA